MQYLAVSLWTFSLFLSAWGLGCMTTVCEKNEDNELIAAYGSARANGELADAVDLKCDEDAVVYAPFEGNISYWKSHVGAEDGCKIEGVKISGVGQWQGYRAYLAPVLLDSFNGYVEKGKRLGVSKDLGCVDDPARPHSIRLTLRRERKIIDPTYHLQKCMCTGQICETNLNNDWYLRDGKHFHFDNLYNGVYGWNLKCPMVEKNGQELERRAPIIKSPIEAKWIGRIRLKAENMEYTGCDNDGLVLLGDGDWDDYEVRLYNVVYKPGLLGHEKIVQGQEIGTRLDCGDSSPDAVFMEVRYRGKIVDISDLISAKLCKKPEFKM